MPRLFGKLFAFSFPGAIAAGSLEAAPARPSILAEPQDVNPTGNFARNNGECVVHDRAPDDVNRAFALERGDLRAVRQVL